MEQKQREIKFDKFIKILLLGNPEETKQIFMCDGDQMNLPSERSVYLCGQGCRKPDRQQSAETWNNKEVQRECEPTNL